MASAIAATIVIGIAGLIAIGTAIRRRG